MMPSCRSNSFRSALPLALGGAEGAPLQLAPFFDYGAAWNDRGDRDAIASAGVALLWEPTTWLSAEVSYGIPVLDTRDSLADEDDQRVQFRLVLQPSDPAQ